ncbi:hypothetical protein [Oceanicoccus sp. KOV_DT_Chl]|uniref:hypothetical protein n=1 Tax=Oceanicoccus sp. KOV_DT_Chl TaxID=1904639 RepID=UPI0011AF3DBD|nr:hypothetical protein [Oceanicoccus sp. KOV_DT_Chl]
MSSPGYWLYYNDRPIIHLNESEQHFYNDKQGYLDHIALQSAGLKDLIEKLERSNTIYTVKYFDEIDSSQVFFRTPTQTKIEINIPKEKI